MRLLSVENANLVIFEFLGGMGKNDEGKTCTLNSKKLYSERSSKQHEHKNTHTLLSKKNVEMKIIITHCTAKSIIILRNGCLCHHNIWRTWELRRPARAQARLLSATGNSWEMPLKRALTRMPPASPHSTMKSFYSKTLHSNKCNKKRNTR